LRTEKRAITRRDFIRTGSRMAMGGLVAIPLMGSSHARETEKSKVVLIRDRNTLDSRGQPDQVVLGDMMDHAVKTLFKVAYNFEQATDFHKQKPVI